MGWFRTLLAVSLVPVLAWGAGELTFGLRETLGETGVGRTELKEPVDVALGADGEVVALDRERGALVRFSRTGRWVGTFGDQPGTARKDVLRQPRSLAVDAKGRFWVVDSGNHRIVILRPDGSVAEVVGSLGSQPGRFRFPADVTFDRRGRAYVADTGNERIEIFRADGTLLTTWERRSKGRRDVLVKPVSVAYSDHGKGSLWVLNEGSSRLERFDLEEGAWIESLDVGGLVSGAVSLEHIEIEPTFYRMFLADSAGKRVLVVSRRGALEAEIRSDEKRSMIPQGLAVTRTLDVYVADSDGTRVVWFAKQ
ncbi:MAG: NHL repeat-containing protein [Deltaproteobacteria bacterium]|nr:NHL repeat-containing protein [Deltaproteobacteria bacterium]